MCSFRVKTEAIANYLHEIPREMDINIRLWTGDLYSKEVRFIIDFEVKDKKAR